MTLGNLHVQRTATVLSLLAVLVFAAPSAPMAQDQSGSQTVMVIGTGRIVNENVTTARSAAISDALVTAVGLVASDLMHPLVMVESFKDLNRLVLSDAGSFIQYKVLTETTSSRIYRVMVEATVSVDNIRELLTQNGILLKKTTPLKVLLLVAEMGLEESSYRYWWGDPFAQSTAESSLADTLNSQGFVVIDHGQILPPILEAHLAETRTWPESEISAEISTEQAVFFGEWFQADVVVVGSADSELAPNTLGDELRSYKGVLSVGAIRTDTGEILAQSNRNVLIADTDDSTGSQRALTKVGAQTGALLSGQIQKAWQQAAETGPVLTTIVVKGGYQLAHFVIFRRILSEIPGVSALQTSSIMPEETILEIEYEGTAQSMAETLLLKSFNGFGINITDAAPDSLRLSLVPN